MAPKLIMCAGGNRRFCDSALRHGWLYGSKLPGTTYAPIAFADQDWKKPARTAYMTALARHKPEMATVRDLERDEQLPEILSWAEEAAQWVQRVIIIPKAFGVIECLPRRIGGADVVLGYSVPTRYGGTSVPVWEFQGWPVHLLGGSPQRQIELRYYFDVVSLDGNYAALKANRFAEFWHNGKWVQLQDIGRGEEWDAPYKAFDLSMRNIMAAWRK